MPNLGKYSRILCDCGHEARHHHSKADIHTGSGFTRTGCEQWKDETLYDALCKCEKPPLEVVFDKMAMRP